MIVRFFRAGISRGESPINYLLSSVDHAGQPRQVAPEVLEGSPSTTVQIINGIARRHKYVSGVISFRNSEQPTRQQLYQLIDRFKAVAAPLQPEQFNSFWVLHEDKGNTELHFVFPMVLLGGTNAKGQDLTGRAMNIRPPGKISEELFTRFQQVMNHELGYDQVVANSLSVNIDHYWHKPRQQVSKKKVDLLEKAIVQGFRRNNCENREDLCRHLEDELGLTITRKCTDFISVKFPGDKKAIRLKGPLFGAQTDYAKLIAESENRPKRLSESQYQQAIERLQQLVAQRAKTMRGEWKNPQKITTKTRRQHGTTSTRRRYHSTQRNSRITHSTTRIAGPSLHTVTTSPTAGSGDLARSMHRTCEAQEPTRHVVHSSNCNGGAGQIGIRRRRTSAANQESKKISCSAPSVGRGLIGLQAQIDAAVADLANAQTIVERVQAQLALAALMKQRDLMMMKQEAERLKELNSETRIRPRGLR